MEHNPQSLAHYSCHSLAGWSHTATISRPRYADACPGLSRLSVAADHHNS